MQLQTSKVVQAVQRMRALGFQLNKRGGQLTVQSPSDLTDRQKDFIRLNKEAILAVIASTQEASPVDKRAVVMAWLTQIEATPEEAAEVEQQIDSSPEMLDAFARSATAVNTVKPRQDYAGKQERALLERAKRECTDAQFSQFWDVIDQQGLDAAELYLNSIRSQPTDFI